MRTQERQFKSNVNQYRNKVRNRVPCRSSLFVLIVSLLLLGLTTKSYGKVWKYPESLDAKIELVLNLEYNATFSHNKPISQPSTTLDYLPAGHQILITLLLSGTKESIEWAAQESEKLIANLETTENESAIWNYVYIRLMLNKTVLHAIQREYWTAMWTFIKTYLHLSTAITNHPNFAPYHTLAELFNEGLKTSIEYDSKLKYLLPNPIKTNNYLLEFSWSEIEKPLFESFNVLFYKNEALLKSQTIVPKTKAEQLVYSIYYLNTHNPQKIRELEKSTTFKHAPIDNFIKGWCSLTEGNYNQARQELKAQLNEKNTVLYKQTALLGIYYMDIIEHRNPDKLKFRERIQNLPESNAWRDKMAEKELVIDHNPQLLQARLLCDGQKYSEAFNILNNITLESIKSADLLEFYYRRGKILFFQKEYNKALEEYKKALSPSIETKSYYKAQAALDCGDIFLLQNDRANALKCYKTSIEQAEIANRTDIEVKANRAIRSLEN